ncbi:tRNA threonylcarbamoyladenosine biosynthesis protein TsaB [Modicisalibacter ilicicola DSM 19980]|uniref:tRNA threonylcarbamoyladenosine biosynthesis protein TsaB n=1 Tax=Modicisalibacter ilicicola DSM 19980 TaxID=1121942 RepID=A0A1M4UMM7_9GAMM|nr:tRNA (adenosine(37)-N6)-threonylcarbamoyltransferase complex dimerization subunit type 1 TsaB [Halomonas ilicicola]SHE57979.1 tRNA threonylcarbamoyladenosine biosynthesis protein TsaB [Halomonas ilicicola DSM 19980]
MATLLALDASSSACSCAVWRDGEVISRFALTPREHTRRLMPMIDEVMAEAGLALADLDGLAYGRGPGSFTGLRIAAGVAQGLAFGLERPLFGVSTLEALALAAHRRHHLRHLVPALDARMNEIYVAAYHCHDGVLTCLMAESVIKPEYLRLPPVGNDIDWCGVGSGWTLWEAMPVPTKDGLSQRLPDLQPAADEMVRLAARAFDAGEGRPAQEVTPVYLRDQVASRRG